VVAGWCVSTGVQRTQPDKLASKDTRVDVGDTYANQIARLPEAARRVAAHSEQLN